MIIRIWLLLGATAAAGFEAACPDIARETASPKDVPSAPDYGELSLLQMDLVVQRRGKKGGPNAGEKAEIQHDGIVDSLSRQALEEASKFQKMSDMLASADKTTQFPADLSSSLSLLQTDLVLKRQGKKRGQKPAEKTEIQGGGIVDSLSRQFLEEATEFQKISQKLAGSDKSRQLPNSSVHGAFGVGQNGVGDLRAFMTAVVTNTFVVVCCVGFFMVVRNRYPLTYSNNVILEQAPLDAKSLAEGVFAWASASWAVTTTEVIEKAGLDQAMLLEFTSLAMRIMATIGIPMFCLMGPLNFFFGGHAAGEDHLSYLSFGNVVDGSPLYWLHAIVVWGVVFAVQAALYAAQRNFLMYRYRWLRELPCPRANTVLVEGLPVAYQCDAELQKFFTHLFGEGRIRSVYVVKQHPALEAAWDAREAAKKALRKARAEQDGRQMVEASAGFWAGMAEVVMKPLEKTKSKEAVQQMVEDISKSILDFDKEIADHAKEIRSTSSAQGEAGFNTSAAFVSFSHRSDAVFALSAQISEDTDDWEMSIPPEPQSVLWNDLRQSTISSTGFTILGYVLTAVLYMAYIPAVIAITNIAKTMNMGPFQPLWAAFAPTIGLQFMVAFLPTFLIMIFRLCFTLKDDASAQQILQNWYFMFQVVFVILITAVGGSMTDFLHDVADKPLSTVPLLAKTLPFATHFYMNFLVLQWTAHAIDLTRWVQLGKYLLCSFAGYDADSAREMSEPEDQDYYGMGSRSARFTIDICIGIIYGTLCPPIFVLAFINFFLCRVIYGYLIPFAETKKPDLGGVFWVQQLRHVFVGNIIYCIVMIGVLFGRASSSGPGFIAAPSIFYVIWSMKKFERAFSWEKLPVPEFPGLWKLATGLTEETITTSLQQATSEYVQPWMKSIVDGADEIAQQLEPSPPLADLEV